MSERSEAPASALAGRAISAVLALASLVWLVFALVLYSNVEHDFVTVPWFALWLSGAVLAIVTLAAVILMTISARRAPHRWWWAAALSAPTALVLWYGMIVFDVPFRVRFELSQGALESFAGSVIAGERSGARDSSMRVGLFTVSEYGEVEGCVRMITTQVFLDDAGLVFCPEGLRPTTVGEDYYDHLGGRWWSWHRSW